MCFSSIYKEIGFYFIVLGAMRNTGIQIPSSDDLDNYTQTGYYEILSSQAPANYIYMGGTASLFVYSVGSGGNTVQFVIAATTGRCAVRLKRATNTWSTWKEITTTALA